MQCPYCGGWHGGSGNPPDVSLTSRVNVPADTARATLQRAMSEMERDPYSEDALPTGDGKLWSPRVYGTDAEDHFVTVAFGKDGTPREGHTLISLGHVPGIEFYEDQKGRKGHEHSGPTGITDRGHY